MQSKIEKITFPNLRGTFQSLDDGKLLYHVESGQYFRIFTDEEGIPFWFTVDESIDLPTHSSFDQLGVSPHATGIDPATTHTVHLPK